MTHIEPEVVPAGDTFEKQLEEGETWENKLIDISAQGASYSINATYISDFTIRNIGVIGQFDTHDNPSQFEVLMDGGSGLIENVYLPGAFEPHQDGNGPTGIYVHAQHSGDLTIRNVNIKRMQDNAIYASSPGHDAPRAEGGITKVENGYMEANAVVGVRLGKTGSYADNVVVKDGNRTQTDGRGFWAYYEDIEISNCDAFNNDPDVQAGGTTYAKQEQATMTVNNCRYNDGVAVHDTNEIIGSSQGEPQDRIPSGVPTSPQEAAHGDTSGSTKQTLRVEGVADISEYKFDFDGGVEPGGGTDTHPHDRQDTTVSFDGGDRVHGWLGSGSVERWHVEEGAELLGAQIDGEVNVTFGGEPVDLSSVGGLVLGDPCATVSCGDGEVCENGECVSTDPCANVSCGDGEVCENGECVPTDPVDPCADVSCGPGEVCKDGQCISTCANVTCGECETCENGQCVSIDDCDPGGTPTQPSGITQAAAALLLGLTAGGAIVYATSRDDSIGNR